MKTATLLFYAVASFLLGAAAWTLVGMHAVLTGHPLAGITQVLSTGVAAVTIGATAVFLLLAIFGRGLDSDG